MHISPKEWKKLFSLRDTLEGEERTLVRRLIRYVEYLEITLRLKNEDTSK